MEQKIYHKTWFIVIMCIILFPVGLFLIRKQPQWEPSKKKKFYIGVAIFVAFVAIATMLTPKASISYDLSTSEITYTTKDIPAKPAQYKDAESYTTERAGEYVIGKAPKDLVTGKEKEFTTAESGEYVAGEDFPAGVYDLEAVSGSGNVMGGSLNEIMAPEGTADLGLDMYNDYYDNHTFKDGDKLQTKGVSIKLIPQSDDDYVIEPNKYNLVAVEGSGNVMGSGLNEIMAPADFNDMGLDMYVDKVENKTFKKGDTLKVMGVGLELQPVEDKIKVKDATEAVPGHEVTERLESSDQGETCYIDDKEAKCKELGKYDELKSSLEATGTITEQVTKSGDEYNCTIDSTETDCKELAHYDELVAQLEGN